MPTVVGSGLSRTPPLVLVARGLDTVVKLKLVTVPFLPARLHLGVRHPIRRSHPVDLQASGG